MSVVTPYPHIPYSHNSLKVFETVARLMSFTHAAEELHVTQSAVSRQVKQLEDELNTALVIRKHRSIELTARGEALYALLGKNYQAVESLLASWQETKQKKIVIKATLSYATRSLIPKIQQLGERYPNYEIVVIPAIDDDQDASLLGNDYDLLIFTTRNGRRYAHSKDMFFLREEFMAPVCAERLSTADGGLESILHMPRLHPTLDHIDWESWLNGSGHQELGQIRNSTFFTLDLALSACLSGQGATVTDLMLVLPELERGFLVCPEGAQVLHSAWQYFCHHRTQSPIVEELVEWIKTETEKETAKLNLLANRFGWGRNLTNDKSAGKE